MKKVGTVNGNDVVRFKDYEEMRTYIEMRIQEIKIENKMTLHTEQKVIDDIFKIAHHQSRGTDHMADLGLIDVIIKTILDQTK
jgi:hypothetical protein